MSWGACSIDDLSASYIMEETNKICAGLPHCWSKIMSHERLFGESACVGRRVWMLLWAGLTVSLSAVGCFGQVGDDGYEFVLVDGGIQTPPERRVVSDPSSARPDDRTPTPDRVVSPDTGTPTDGNTSTEPVYYADVYSALLKEFCEKCHGDKSGRSRVDAYSSATHEVIAKQKTPIAYWTLVWDRLKRKEMPPVKPDAEDEKVRLADGIALFERWAQAGFPEKKGGSTSPNDYKGKEDPFTIFPTTATCKGVTPMPARLWRLTSSQLRYSLLDVFGATLTLPTFQLSSKRAGGVTNSASESGLDNVDVTNLVQQFEAFGKEVLAKVPRWKSCLAQKDTACVKQLIAQDGRLLWRRSPTQAESDKLIKNFQTLAASARDIALSYVLERMLLSPNFLFRSEMGAPDASQPGMLRLTPHEVAAFLSYTMWQSVPDVALLQAADENKLNTIEQVRAQVDRMLKDERAKRGLSEFLVDWLHIRDLLTQEKDASVFKTLTTQLRQDVVGSASQFLDFIIWNQKGKIADIFHSDVAFANESVAKLYGNTTVKGAAFQQIKLDANQRTGILTSPAFLMAHSGKDTTGFVHRGVFFLEELACRPVGDPPMGAVAAGLARVAKADTSKMTQREIMESVHSADPSCNTCHIKIDPIGASFEIFDPMGQFRTTERGKTIKASGKLEGLGDMKPDFKDAVELVKNLAGSEHFRQCFTLKLYTYTWGRPPEGERNCAVATLYEHLKSNQFTLLETYKALLTNQQFFLRVDPKSTKGG